MNELQGLANGLLFVAIAQVVVTFLYIAFGYRGTDFTSPDEGEEGEENE